MAGEWLLYDKKEEIKLNKDIEFPFTVTNFSRKTKECKNKEELYGHIICRKELKEITQILAAKVHPEILIEEDTFLLISHFMRHKRYGMNFIYPRGMDEIPNSVLLAFDIIQNTLDKDEADKIKTMKEKNKKNSK